MTTNVSSNVGITNSNVQMNPYSFTDMSMANDVFGSQIFGNNQFNYQQKPRFTKAPNDLASELVQQTAYANTVNSAPTMQDYYQASQVANMFMNPSNMSMSPYTSYTQNDIFAQQAMPMMFNNGQAFA